MSAHSYSNTLGNVSLVEKPYWKRILHRGKHRRGSRAVALIAVSIWGPALFSFK